MPGTEPVPDIGAVAAEHVFLVPDTNPAVSKVAGVSAVIHFLNPFFIFRFISNCGLLISSSLL
jgi:hypothetical protein